MLSRSAWSGTSRTVDSVGSDGSRAKMPWDLSIEGSKEVVI
jgi:hypothetical protein